MNKILFVGSTSWKLPNLKKFFATQGIGLDIVSLDQYKVNDSYSDVFFITSSQSLLPSYESDFLLKHPHINKIFLVNIDFDDYEDFISDFRSRFPHYAFNIYDERALSENAKCAFGAEQIDFVVKNLQFISDRLKLAHEIQNFEKERVLLAKQMELLNKAKQLQNLVLPINEEVLRTKNLNSQKLAHIGSLLNSFQYKPIDCKYTKIDKLNSDLNISIQEVVTRLKSFQIVLIPLLFIVGGLSFYQPLMMIPGIALTVACFYFNTNRLKLSLQTLNKATLVNSNAVRTEIKTLNSSASSNENELYIFKTVFQKSCNELELSLEAGSRSVIEKNIELNNRINDVFIKLGNVSLLIKEPEIVPSMLRVLKINCPKDSKIIDELNIIEDNGVFYIDEDCFVIRYEYLPNDDAAPTRVYNIVQELLIQIQFFAFNLPYAPQEFKFLNGLQLKTLDSGDLQILNLNSFDNEIKSTLTEALVSLQPNELLKISHFGKKIA